jgi:hypothetical protein
VWAAAGTLFEQFVNAEGETEHREHPSPDQARHHPLQGRHRSAPVFTAATPCLAPHTRTTTGGSHCSPPPRTPRPSSTAPSTCASPRPPVAITAGFTACAKTLRASTPNWSGPSTANASPHGECTTRPPLYYSPPSQTTPGPDRSGTTRHATRPSIRPTSSGVCVGTAKPDRGLSSTPSLQDEAGVWGLAAATT